MSWTNEQIDEAMEKIAERASTDSAFRELCFSNPHEAIKAATGQVVPESFKIRFIGNEGAHATYVLPDFKESADQLTDTDLDAVAGGFKDRRG